MAVAGAWIKLEHTMPDKPEVVLLSDRLGIDQDAVVGKLIRFWVWADQQLVSGSALRVTSSFIDRLTNCSGFSLALIEVGWLKDRNGALSIPNFARHNGQTAKARALTSDRVKRSRNGTSVTGPLPDERERKTRGRGRARGKNNTSYRERPDRPIGAARSPPIDRSRVDTFDLSSLDWSGVLRMAEAAAKRVPPQSDEDRRAWLKYAVMAAVTFSEAWLVESAETVAIAKETKVTRQAHFVAVLKSKAAEQGVDAETFNGMARRIEIPDEVWQSEVLT